MARKKSRRGPKSSDKKRGSGRKVVASSRKMGMILGNLILSAVLFLVSLGLYLVTENEILMNFFGILAIIFGSIGLAFLIVYSVFLVLKIMKK